MKDNWVSPYKSQGETGFVYVQRCILFEVGTIVWGKEILNFQQCLWLIISTLRKHLDVFDYTGKKILDLMGAIITVRI